MKGTRNSYWLSSHLLSITEPPRHQGNKWKPQDHHVCISMAPLDLGKDAALGMGKDGDEHEVHRMYSIYVYNNDSTYKID